MTKVNGYLVTITEVKTMLPVKGSTPTDSNKIVTKEDVLNYFYVNQTVEPFASYSLTRCPRYEDLVAPSALTITNGSVSCTVGGAGSFTSSFSGGTNIYLYAAISDISEASAIARVAGYGPRVTLSAGQTSYNWTGLASKTWYTAVMDSSNFYYATTSTLVNCPGYLIYSFDTSSSAYTMRVIINGSTYVTLNATTPETTVNLSINDSVYVQVTATGAGGLPVIEYYFNGALNQTWSATQGTINSDTVYISPGQSYKFKGYAGPV